MEMPRSFVLHCLPGMPVLGGLATGDPQGANSFQIAGVQSGMGSMGSCFPAR